jgi:hypothetical protein
MAGSRCDGEDGDDDRGYEPTSERLEEAGQRQPRHASPGEGGRELSGDRDHQDCPGNPDHQGQGVHKGLVGNALLVEGAADLARGRDMMRKGPANEVPQGPRDSDDQCEEEHEGTHTPKPESTDEPV